MTGKRYNWHKEWSRLPDGWLAHSSGVIIAVNRYDGYTDFEIDKKSLDEFQAAQDARGIPLTDTLSCLKRLLKEAQRWHARNP